MNTGHGLVLVYVLQRRIINNINSRTYHYGISKEKWRFDDEIYIPCHFVIICLIVKMWFVSYLSKS